MRLPGKSGVDQPTASTRVAVTGSGTGFMLGGNAISLLVALAVDAWFGDPDRLWRRTGHPVAWCGRCLAALETRFNHGDAARRRRAGMLSLLLLLSAVATIGLLLQGLVLQLPASGLLEGLLASILIAQRSLADHVKAVAVGLSGSVEVGRDAVRHLVGRDLDDLDASGVAGGAIESLAENFSDGVVAPALAFLLFGLPGILVYKAINTADSMIGHRSARYRDYGRFAARLDDVANWVPARLSAGLIALAAGAGRERPLDILRRTRRDAPRHRSPNAGWPEAAMAAALGIALAGPRSYDGETVAHARMNEGGRKSLILDDIHAALTIYWRACAILAGLVAGVWILAG